VDRRNEYQRKLGRKQVHHDAPSPYPWFRSLNWRLIEDLGHADQFAYSVCFMPPSAHRQGQGFISSAHACVHDVVHHFGSKTNWGKRYKFKVEANIFRRCVGRYRTAAWVKKRVRSTSLYHSRQWCIVIKPRLDCLDYTVVCFMTHDCSRKRYQCEPAKCGLN